MSKFMRNSAVTALIFIVVGFAMAFVAGSIKGVEVIQSVVDSVTQGRVQLDLNGILSEIEEWEIVKELEENVNYDIDENMIFDDNFEIFSGDAQAQFADVEIGMLDIEVGGCNFVINESTDDVFRVNAEGTRRFQCFVKDRTLYIKGTVKTVVDTNNQCQITLSVPEGFTFAEVDAEIGAWVMDLGSISADKMDMEVGACQITADTLVADTLNVTVGMGEVVIEDMQVNKLDAEVGMGNFRADGTVSEKADVECAMGNIEMEIAGAQKEYNYDIECGMGNVDIGDNSYSGLANEQSIDNGADRKMDVECAVGNISIRFTK